MTTAKFTLHVSSPYSSEVWPIRAREHPEIDARIEESYYADPDECCASIEIRDMDDLRAILKFYDESRASFILGASIDTPDFKAYSSMDLNFIRGGYHATHTEAMSPGTAAAKLRSMAQAMEKWERDEAKKIPS
jgi:hypothetical protein